MTCDDCLEHLDDWLDGALDPDTAAQVAAHVASCDECRQIAEDAKFLRPLVAEWPREVEPPRDLWPEVRAAIAPAPARRWQAPRALAAAAFLVVALGSGAAGYWLRDVPSAPPSIDVARFESQVDTASAELAAAVEARRDELDPETYETVQRNLAIIDAAIEETRRALERDPDDRRAADALVAAHQQKIRMLRQVLWAPGRNG